MKVTSRGRPEILRQTVAKYIELATSPHLMRWVFSFDDDDQSDYSGLQGLVFFNKPSNKIQAINSNVPDDCWDILLNISDDQIPIMRGYDDVIRNSMPDDLDASLWFNDGWQMRINTQEIIGRNYYHRFGYIYNPVYKSFFCDNESTAQAIKLGKSIKDGKCIIKHFHPGWDKNSHIKRDELYNRNDKYWAEDEATYNRRKHEL